MYHFTRAGDAGGLEALLASEAAESAKSQPEVASALKALQAAKARAEAEAEAARWAAGCCSVLCFFLHLPSAAVSLVQS